MSLENLLKIKRLQVHNASQDSILKLLAAAERNLDDARAQNISAENRFDAAYKTILQCAMAPCGPTAIAPRPACPDIT